MGRLPRREQRNQVLWWNLLAKRQPSMTRIVNDLLSAVALRFGIELAFA